MMFITSKVSILAMFNFEIENQYNTVCYTFLVDLRNLLLFCLLFFFYLGSENVWYFFLLGGSKFAYKTSRDYGFGNQGNIRSMPSRFKSRTCCIKIFSLNHCLKESLFKIFIYSLPNTSQSIFRF